MKNSGVLDGMKINGENNCFLTLKDHKENFNINHTVRLINPAKNELGRMRKKLLQNLNRKLRTELSLNQWKNTASVIEWFKYINEKHLNKFMVFDIKEFYPSIKENLLRNALEFASAITTISSKDK